MGGKLKKPPCSSAKKISFLEPGVEVEVVVDVEVMVGRIITLRKGPMSLME